MAVNTCQFLVLLGLLVFSKANIFHGNLSADVIDCRFNETISNVVQNHSYHIYSCTANLDNAQIYSVNVATSIDQDIQVQRIVDFSVSVHNTTGIIQSDTWELPLRKAGKSFHQYNRAFCTQTFSQPSKPEIRVSVQVSTKSHAPVNFSIRVFLKDIYVTDQSQDTELTLNFSRPEFFVLKPSVKALSYSHIQLEITSDNDECMSVVIQKAHCPLEKPENTDGVIAYFTVSKSNRANKTSTQNLLKTKDLGTSFMITFYLHETKQWCTQSSHVTCRDRFPNFALNTGKELNFRISTYNVDYFKPTLICILVLLGGLVIIVVTGPFISFLFRKVEVDNQGPSDDTENLVSTTENSQCTENRETCEPAASASDNDNKDCLGPESDQAGSAEPGNEETNATEMETEVPDMTAQETAQAVIREQEFLGVFLKLRRANEPSIKDDDSFNLRFYLFFLYQVCSTVFIALQTVWNSKDLDLCHHNYRCMRPFWGLESFNHVLVLSAYPLCGLIVFVVAFVKQTRKTFNNYMAMGVSLFVYGISFMVYKICPTYDSIQFNASLVYGVVLWCVICLYPNQKEDVKTERGLFTIGISCDVINFVVNRWGFRYYSAMLTALFTVLSIALPIHIDSVEKGYAWEFDGKSKRSLQQVVKSFYVPILNLRKTFIFLIGLNLVITILTWVLGVHQQFLLFFLVLYLLYIWLEEIMRFLYSPKLIFKHFIEAYVYLSLAVSVYKVSSIYAQHDILVAIDCAPAFSRMLNQDCTRLDFYDDSDVKYFLDALVAFLMLLRHLKSMEIFRIANKYNIQSNTR